MCKARGKFFKKMESNRWMQIIFFVSTVAITLIIYFWGKQYIEHIKGLSSGTEFLRTIDCAPLINEHGTEKVYRISFELKTKMPGEVLIYCQNGETSKYFFEERIYTSTEFQRYTIDVTPVARNMNVEESYLAFYGGYGSGVIPCISGDISFEVVDD